MTKVEVAGDSVLDLIEFASFAFDGYFARFRGARRVRNGGIKSA
jgi:hypothetical protein